MEQSDKLKVWSEDELEGIAEALQAAEEVALQLGMYLFTPHAYAWEYRDAHIRVWLNRSFHMMSVWDTPSDLSGHREMHEAIEPVLTYDSGCVTRYIPGAWEEHLVSLAEELRAAKKQVLWS